MRFAISIVTVVALSVTGFTAQAAAQTIAPRADVPALSSMAAYLLVDRATNNTEASLNPDKQFRSASLVKLLIALDYLDSVGSLDKVPADKMAQLRSMLQSSDDEAAHNFWEQAGETKVIDRMVPKIGLEHTQAPADPVYWGYTAISASDIIKIYQYLLADTPEGFGKFIVDNLHHSTQCAKDGRDQYFGIPSAVPPPWGVKQGWSGFGDVTSDQQCQATDQRKAKLKPQRPEKYGAEAPRGVRLHSASEPDVDLKSPLLHTSGLVQGDSKILVVLSLYPEKTSWRSAAKQITTVTKTVYAMDSADTSEYQ